MQIRKAAKSAVCVATIAAGVLAGLAGTSGQASAAESATASHSAGWYDSVTCSAFWAWGRHRDARHLGWLYGDSRHADTYLRVDVGGLHRVIVRRSSRRVIGEWRRFVWADCTWTGDEGS